MNLKNLRKEARKAISIDGITHTEFLKNFSDKYDLNQEKIAKEISQIPSEEKIKKHKFVRNLFLIIYVAFFWLGFWQGTRIIYLGISNSSQIANEIESNFLIVMYIIVSLPTVFAFFAFFSHKRSHYLVSGSLMCFYVLNGMYKGMYNQNGISLAFILIPAVLPFYITSLLKHRYEKKEITSTKDGNETLTTEYLFED